MVDGEFAPGRGNEEARLGMSLWNSGIPFCLRATASGDGPIHKFITVEVCVGKIGPVSYYGQSTNSDTQQSNHDMFSWHQHARSWVDDCLKKHARCKQPAREFHPTRMLEVLNVDKQLRLSTTKMQCYYAALSYCWGENQLTKLTTINLSTYITAIDETILPKAISDAVHVTRSVGIRFLWVDAYCIIQDSEDDKVKEINHMDEIYKNALFTIAAARSGRVTEGFLGHSEADSTHFNYPLVYTNGNITTLALRKIPDIDLAVEPLSRRAWTLQERLLSPRTLSFLSKGALLEWECDSAWESNIGPIEKPFGTRSRLFSTILPRHGNPSIPIAWHRLCYRWGEIVGDYSSRALSNSEDKLLAISAVAKEFARAFGNHYCAGLWGSILVPQLLWRVVSPPGKRIDKYRSPSWSWASIDGSAELLPYPSLSDPTLSILECKISPVDSVARFGAVKSATLTVQGPLKKATVRAGKLYDSITGEFVTHVMFDCEVSKKNLPVWCLLITRGSSRESDVESNVETLGSETSQDYPDTPCALLLTEDHYNKDAFQRVGITQCEFDLNPKWFDDAVMRAIDII